MLQTVTNLADEFSDIVDVSGGVEAATLLLQQTERTDRIQSIERLLTNKQFALAEVAIDDLALNDNLTTAEIGLLSRFSDRLVVSRLSTELATLKNSQTRIFSLQASEDIYTRIESLLTLSEKYADLIPATEKRDLLAYGVAAARKRTDTTTVTARLAKLREAGADAALIQQAQGPGRRPRR